MKKCILIFAGLLVSCGPQPSIAAQTECEDTAERLTENDSVCDLQCKYDNLLAECCICLSDFDCIDVSAQRCVDNIDRGGSINVLVGCTEDSSRCYAFCNDVISTVEE